jgi:hypothetical protein
MGLTMVQTVVHRHDGVIDWRSEKGHGTVFTVTLPLCMDEANPGCEREPSRAYEPKLLEQPRLAVQT